MGLEDAKIQLSPLTEKGAIILKTLTCFSTTDRLHCHGLTSVTIPEGCVEIEGFAGCVNLSKIAIRNSVSSFGKKSSAIVGNCNLLLFQTDLAEFPNPVSGAPCFSNCVHLVNVSIPESISDIQGQAFGVAKG